MSLKIVAGIDEAGLGPKLGPLVVSSVVFRTKHDPQHTTLHELMPDTLTRDAPLEDFRLRLDDSKKVYRGARGLAHLEKTALGFWSAMHGKRPNNLGEWLEKLAPETLKGIKACPWYGTHPLDLTLPRVVTSELIDRSSERLLTEMKSNGCQALAFRQRILTAPDFNRMIETEGNKAIVLGSLVRDLISKLPLLGEGAYTQVDVDKLGGRIYYGDMLQSLFPHKKLALEEENPACSSYCIRHKNKRTRIAFTRKGDRLHAHIALASIFSKYTRELLMQLFNRFWLSHAPSLKPTAGYPQDAARFLNEIVDLTRTTRIDPSRFTRIR